MVLRKVQVSVKSAADISRSSCAGICSEDAPHRPHQRGRGCSHREKGDKKPFKDISRAAVAWCRTLIVTSSPLPRLRHIIIFTPLIFSLLLFLVAEKTLD